MTPAKHNDLSYRPQYATSRDDGEHATRIADDLARQMAPYGIEHRVIIKVNYDNPYRDWVIIELRRWRGEDMYTIGCRMDVKEFLAASHDERRVWIMEPLNKITQPKETTNDQPI